METTTARKGAKLSEKEILKHEFLTIAEVALLLRVTQRTVYNPIYNGSLRATKMTTRITIIPKEDFMNMIRINDYNRANGLNQQQGKEIHFPSVADTIGTEPELPSTEKPTPRKPHKPRSRKTPLKPSSDFKQSVKDTFAEASDISEPVYTLEEICKKYYLRTLLQSPYALFHSQVSFVRHTCIVVVWKHCCPSGGYQSISLLLLY